MANILIGATVKALSEWGAQNAQSIDGITEGRDFFNWLNNPDNPLLNAIVDGNSTGIGRLVVPDRDGITRDLKYVLNTASQNGNSADGLQEAYEADPAAFMKAIEAGRTNPNDTSLTRLMNQHRPVPVAPAQTPSAEASTPEPSSDVVPSRSSAPAEAAPQTAVNNPEQTPGPQNPISQPSAPAAPSIAQPAAPVAPTAPAESAEAKELRVATQTLESGLVTLAYELRNRGVEISDPGPADGTFDAASEKTLQIALINIRRGLGLQGDNLHRYTPEIGQQILDRLHTDPSLAERKDEVEMLVGCLDVLHKNGKISPNVKEGVDNSWLPGVNPMMFKGIEMGLEFLKSNMPGLFDLISNNLLGIVNTVLGFMGIPMTVQQMFPKVFPPETTPPAQPVTSLAGEYRSAMEFGLKAGFSAETITNATMGVMKNILKLPATMPAEAQTELTQTIEKAFRDSQAVLTAQGEAGLDQASQLFEQNLRTGIDGINQRHSLNLQLPGLKTEDRTALRAQIADEFRENADDAGVTADRLTPLEQQYAPAPVVASAPAGP